MPTIKILAPMFKSGELAGFAVMGEMEFPAKIKRYLAPILVNEIIIGYLSILNHKETLAKYFEKTTFNNKVAYQLKSKE